MAKQKRQPERALSSHHSNADFLNFALDRIKVLEEIVGGMALRAGAHPPYVERWQQYITKWPDNPQDSSLSQESQYLTHWANHGR
jgi:hypothetical protein